jgi:hypothetical protein
MYKSVTWLLGRLPEKSLGERFRSVFFQNSLKGKKKKKADPNMEHPQGCQSTFAILSLTAFLGTPYMQYTR